MDWIFNVPRLFKLTGERSSVDASSRERVVIEGGGDAAPLKKFSLGIGQFLSQKSFRKMFAVYTRSWKSGLSGFLPV